MNILKKGFCKTDYILILPTGRHHSYHLVEPYDALSTYTEPANHSKQKRPHSWHLRNSCVNTYGRVSTSNSFLIKKIETAKGESLFSS